MNDTTLTGLRDFPIGRRGLITSGLAPGLTLATTRVDAQVIHTDMQGIDANEIRVPVEDGTLPGYFARPNGNGPFPIVLVNEEVFGIHDYIKDVCRRLAKLGYLAVAVEIYARLGDISKADGSELFPQFISKTPDAQVMSDLDRRSRGHPRTR